MENLTCGVWQMSVINQDGHCLEISVDSGAYWGQLQRIDSPHISFHRFADRSGRLGHCDALQRKAASPAGLKSSHLISASCFCPLSNSAAAVDVATVDVASVDVATVDVVPFMVHC